MSKRKKNKSTMLSDEIMVEEEVIESTEDTETVSIYEAAEHFKTSENTIKMWIDHGHLRMTGGRVLTSSINSCRFNTRRFR